MWSLPSVKSQHRGQPFICSYVTLTWEKNQIPYLVPLKQTTEESLLFYTTVFMQTTQSWVQRCRRCHAGYRSVSWCWKKRHLGLHTLHFWNVLWCSSIWPVLSCFWGPELLNSVRSCLKKKAFIVSIAKFQQWTMIHVFSVTALRWGLITCALCNFAGLVLA